MPRSRASMHVVAIMFGAMSVVVGCSDGSDDEAVSAGRFDAVSGDSLTDESIPQPSGTVALEVTGALSRPNSGSKVQFDLATLERLGLREGVVFEPWEKTNMRFTGVDLVHLLDSVGASQNATSVHLTALDDYQVDLAMAEIRSGTVILATRQDGAPIPLDKGGPTRIVFGPDAKSGENPDQWIWSIAQIEIRV